MDAYKVSTRVGNVRNNDASLIEDVTHIVEAPPKKKDDKDQNRHTLFD